MGFLASAATVTLCVFLAMWTVQGLAIGSWTAVEDKNSEEFRSLVAFAEAQLIKSLGASAGQLKIVKVVKAEQQLVAGLNYALEVELASLQAGSNSSPCDIDHSKEYRACSINMFRPLGPTITFELKEINEDCVAASV